MGLHHSVVFWLTQSPQIVAILFLVISGIRGDMNKEKNDIWIGIRIGLIALFVVSIPVAIYFMHYERA